MEQHSCDLVEPMAYLYVKVVKARSLAAKDAGGTTDPRDNAGLKSLNPDWNRVFAFLREKLHGLEMEISVWDACMVGADDFLGALTFLVDEIPTRKPPESPLVAQWHKLEERTGKPRVKGGLMLALWMGNQGDEAFQEAWQSDTGGNPDFRSKVYPSPKLWYLRVHIIEAEDLLPPEIGRVAKPFVEIQLGMVQTQRVIVPDVKGVNPVWDKERMFVAAEPFEELLVISIKDRVAPNKEEIMGVSRIHLSTVLRRFDGRQMPARLKWFEDIYNWKNPGTTVLVRPPLIDDKFLEGGDYKIEDLDELDEELNVLMGDKTERLLKLKYERLRFYAGEVQNFLGGVAIQGERLQALLSWRDPSATSIFVTFCLIAAIFYT